MQTHPVEAVLFTLMQTGLQSVGCRIPVEHDVDAIYVRNLVVVVTDMGRIECCEMSNPETPVMTFPMDATQSAAAAIVMHVLTGVVTRAIEADEVASME